MASPETPQTYFECRRYKRTSNSLKLPEPFFFIRLCTRRRAIELLCNGEEQLIQKVHYWRHSSCMLFPAINKLFS